MALKIQKGIAIPKSRSKMVYPWDSMQVGDSFFIDGKTQRQVAPSLYRSAKRHGVKITVRSSIFEGESGVMVWRLK